MGFMGTHVGFMEDSWKISWIHGAKMFIPWRKEKWQVFRSQYIDMINILHIFWPKKGFLGAVATDLEKV